MTTTGLGKPFSGKHMGKKKVQFWNHITINLFGFPIWKSEKKSAKPILFPRRKIFSEVVQIFTTKKTYFLPRCLDTTRDTHITFVKF